MSNEINVSREMKNRKQPYHCCMEAIGPYDKINFILENDEDGNEQICLVIDEYCLESIKKELRNSRCKVIGVREFVKGNISLYGVDAIVVYDTETIVNNYRKYKKYALKMQLVIERFRGCVIWCTSMRLNMKNMLMFTGNYNVHEETTRSVGGGLDDLIHGTSEISFFTKLDELKKIISDELDVGRQVLVVTDRNSAMQAAVLSLQHSKKRNLILLSNTDSYKWKEPLGSIETLIVDFYDILTIGKILSRLIKNRKKINLYIYVNERKMNYANKKYIEVRKRLDLFFENSEKYVDLYHVAETDDLSLTYVKKGKRFLTPQLNIWTVSYYMYLNRSGISSTKEIYMNTIYELLGIKK